MYMMKRMGKEKDHLGSIALERAQNLGGILAFDIPYRLALSGRQGVCMYSDRIL